jgi:hypothetical protein
MRQCARSDRGAPYRRQRIGSSLCRRSAGGIADDRIGFWPDRTAVDDVEAGRNGHYPLGRKTRATGREELLAVSATGSQPHEATTVAE